MKVVTIDSEESAWDLFIRSIEDATSYHRLKWRNVITESFGHNCHYLAAIDNNGEWQGMLPLVHMRSRLFGHFLISVPFVNYDGLLCNNIRLQACCWMRQNGCGGLLGQLMLNCDTRGEVLQGYRAGSIRSW